MPKRVRVWHGIVMNSIGNWSLNMSTNRANRVNIWFWTLSLSYNAYWVLKPFSYSFELSLYDYVLLRYFTCLFVRLSSFITSLIRAFNNSYLPRLPFICAVGFNPYTFICVISMTSVYLVIIWTVTITNTGAVCCLESSPILLLSRGVGNSDHSAHKIL